MWSKPPRSVGGSSQLPDVKTSDEFKGDFCSCEGDTACAFFTPKLLQDAVPKTCGLHQNQSYLIFFQTKQTYQQIVNDRKRIVHLTGVLLRNTFIL